MQQRFGKWEFAHQGSLFFKKISPKPLTLKFLSSKVYASGLKFRTCPTACVKSMDPDFLMGTVLKVPLQGLQGL